MAQTAKRFSADEAETLVFFPKNQLDLCDTSVILALVLLDQDKRTKEHQG